MGNVAVIRVAEAAELLALFTSKPRARIKGPHYAGPARMLPRQTKSGIWAREPVRILWSSLSSLSYSKSLDAQCRNLDIA